MATIITSSYFVGEIAIPNSAPSNPEGAELDLFIQKYEAKFLSELLGYELAKLVIEAIEPPANTSGVIYDLINGKEYTDSLGDLNKWPGWKNVGQSAIANYIYTQYMRSAVSQTTSLGEKRTKSENMADFTPTYKIVKAWNDMVDLNSVMHEFLIVNEVDYPTYKDITTISTPHYVKQNILGI